MEGGGNAPARKVMLVADPTRESEAALQYVLSHVVLENDTLFLLHVVKNRFLFFKRPSSAAAASTAGAAIGNEGGGGGGGNASGELNFLEQMKEACGVAQPKVHVHTAKVEMDCKDKATTIISQATLHGIDLLVVGKRQSLSNAILGPRRRNRSIRGQETAEYLIENSKCTCVAVQKKGQKEGYILNTKTQKNFWLLA